MSEDRSPQILWLDYSQRFRGDSLSAAKRLGLSVHVVSPVKNHGTMDGIATWDVVPDLYSTNQKPLLRLLDLAELYNCTSVFTQEDELLELWSELSVRVSGDSVSKSYLQGWNKFHVRAALDSSGLNPKWIHINSREQLLSFQRHARTIVLKPSDSSSGSGITAVASSNDLDAALIVATESCRNPKLQVLAEEFIDGPQFSLEYVVNSLGDVQHLATTEYIVKHRYLTPSSWKFETVGYRMPPDIEAEVHDLLIAAGILAVRQCSIVSATVHAELKFSSAGPKVIELNPRLPGGFVTRAVTQYTGVNYPELALRIARGEWLPDIDFAFQNPTPVAIAFRTDRLRRTTRSRTPPGARLIESERWITDETDDEWRWNGYVLVAHKNLDEVWESAMALANET